MIKAVVHSKLFWIGLTIRVACLPFFHSHYLDELFIPFIDRFVSHPFENPWNQFPAHVFPYGPVMLVCISLGKFLGYHLFGSAALGTAALGLTLIKLPILMIDFGLLLLLFRLAGHQGTSIIIYYWLNPVVIYVNFIYGQLDLASMAFCIAAVYLIIIGRTRFSAVAFAAAILSKFQVVLALPVVLTFLWNADFARPALKKIAWWSSVCGGLVALGLYVAVTDIHYVTVGSPEALRIFAAHLDLGSAQKLYLGPLLVMLTLGYLGLTTRMSSRGLLFGIGCVFGVLLLTTSTVPSWYLWVLPFLSLFCAIYNNAPRVLYWSFSVLLVAYSIVAYQTKITLPPLLQGVAFTIVQTLLLGMTLAVWVIAVRVEAVLEHRTRSLFIGIAGDSGSGKDYLVHVLQDIFYKENTTVIAGDDYHRWERANQKWSAFTHLNPQANDLRRLDEHTDNLAKGLSVRAPHYDHALGTFDKAREIKPSPVVIVQGLHTLYLTEMRDTFGLKIFLAPDETVQIWRKIRRDVKERGHDREKVLASLERRRLDSQTHIQPQRNFANWVIEYHPVTTTSRDNILSGMDLEIETVHIVPNDAGMLGLVNALVTRGVEVSFLPDGGNLDRARLSGGGALTNAQVRSIAYELFHDLRQRTRSRREPAWREGMDGLTQLIALGLIGRRVGNAIHQTSSQPNRRAA